MFQKAELEHLKSQKDLLVWQSNAHRLLLAVEWQRLRTPENWLKQAGGLAGRNPMWTALLAAAAGVLAVKIMRKPGTVVDGLGGLGKLASAALVAWKLFRAKTPE